MGIRSGRGKTAYSSGKRGYAEQYVTEGNTVRVVRTDEARKKAIRHEHRPNTRAAEHVEAAKKPRTVSLTFPLTVLLTAAMAVVFVVGYKYLCLKSSIDLHMDNVKSLETRLENLRTENDALERSIDTSIDLNHVYEVATNKLGMVPANKSNIIQYDKTESEYVRQYDDIPSAEQ